MTATATARLGATVATGRLRLRFDLIDQWAAERNAKSDRAIAKLLGLSNSTVGRFRSGEMGPSLPRAMDIAAKLGISVEELVGSADRR